jgi:hypothetical protein
MEAGGLGISVVALFGLLFSRLVFELAKLRLSSSGSLKASDRRRNF